MGERLLVVIGLVAVVFLVSLAVRSYARRRTAATVGAELPSALHGRVPERQQSIVYFYGPHCGACRQQRAILERLSLEMDVPVLAIDAASETAVAGALGVLTVPSTVIVDRARRVRAVNLGFRAAQALVSQLRETAHAAA